MMRFRNQKHASQRALIFALTFVASGCGGGTRGDAIALGTLVEAASVAGSYAYAYDRSGLMASIGSGTGTALATITRTGSEVRAGADTYELDALGRVATANDLTVVYGADGHIDRAARGAFAVSYVYDEAGNRLLRSKNGSPTDAYVDGNHITADALDELVTAGGRTVGVLRNGALVMTATDMRGTVHADADGTTKLASPYGARPTQPDLAATVAYAAKGYDDVLGTIRMGVRDYDPRIGQFMQPDPLFLLAPEKCVESPIECSLYGYAKSRPLDFVDPTGNAADAAAGMCVPEKEAGSWKAIGDAPMSEAKGSMPPEDLRFAVGSQNYYQLRQQDFDNRNQMSGGLVTGYYLNYGDKNEQKFIARKSQLGLAAQQWVGRALVNLQSDIEAKRIASPSAFSKLEQGSGLRDFAFRSHGPAYLDAGLASLSWKDAIKIGFTPDFKDVASREGRAQAFDVGMQFVAHKWSELWTRH